MYEQHEIEFNPVDAEEAVEQLLIAKWILRMLGQKYGVTISFAPKITVGKAGSGLHIHFLAEKDGINHMADENGLTDVAKKMIAGILDKGTVLDRIWKYHTHFLPAAGTTSGGPHHGMLG